MNRRRALQSIGTISATALAGCSGKLSEKLSHNEANQKPYKEFGGKSGFKRAEWTNENKLAVTVADDHDMDGLGIRYYAKDSIEDDIVVKEAPSYGGTVSLNFFGALADKDSYPPAGKYQLVAYKGQFGSILNIAEETIGKVNFYIEPSLSVETTSLVKNQRISLQLRNEGNAPVFVRRVVTDEGSAAVRNFVSYEGDTMISTQGLPFRKEDNCTIIPTETELEIESIPKLKTSATLNTKYKKSERVCSIKM
ncbi:hypothetical protein V5735_12985 (plasmid) [Haladaptatus sp. SPP-AMP-3]|uniref:hypothetical protein n=1 Tax=Haladaptatus sp. SPP-AMP-3 TaxID=3121295 RepID=UPI003C2B6EAB